MPAAPTAVLVTRPDTAGRELVADLGSLGFEALWWPVFELLPPADAGALAAIADQRARLAEFDVAIAISPAAARFGAAALPGLAGVPMLAAVGAGSRAALASSLQVPLARVLGPDAADPSGGGAESLWPLLAPNLAACRRALILRAPEGRDWLAGRLVEAGVAVTELAVYRREPVGPDPGVETALRARAAAGGAGAIVVTSSAAVAPIEAQCERLPGVADWLHRGVGIGSHPRIAERLRAAGYARCACCAPIAEAIAVALRGV